jgi:hypothetical protein
MALPTPLATQADAHRLGYTLESGREESLLARASARIRRAAGKHITSITSTVRVDVENCRALLPGGPVTAVSAVAYTADDGGTAITGWRWNGYDKIERLWLKPCATQVNVTYTHGLTSIPDELAELVCSVAQRLGPEDTATGMTAGIRSESIDDYSVTYAAEAREDAGSLLPGEERQLARILGTPTAFVVRVKS